MGKEWRLSFAHSINHGEIWPSLLEKAWATLHGSYAMMRKGSPIIALEALTFGNPYKIIEHDDGNGVCEKDWLLKKLKKALVEKK